MTSRNACAFIIVAVTAGASGGCGRHATTAECSALLDRYVELLVRERDPKADEAEIGKQKSATREKAAHDESFASCPKEVRATAVRCAMGAPNVDEFEKCLE